jgi:hypothetical protein
MEDRCAILLFCPGNYTSGMYVLKHNFHWHAVSCELCGGSGVPPPLAAHMRHAHPGCRAPTTRGYDRSGTYRRADILAPADSPLSIAACGQLAQGQCQGHF